MLPFFIGTIIMSLLVHGLFVPWIAWSLTTALWLFFIWAVVRYLADDLGEGA